jgi:hypothetical protein
LCCTTQILFRDTEFFFRVLISVGIRLLLDFDGSRLSVSSFALFFICPKPLSCKSLQKKVFWEILLFAVTVNFDIFNVGYCFFQTLFQGDKIGQIFAYWAIVYFRQFFENYSTYIVARATLFTLKVMHYC